MARRTRKSGESPRLASPIPSASTTKMMMKTEKKEEEAAPRGPSSATSPARPRKKPLTPR